MRRFFIVMQIVSVAFLVCGFYQTLGVIVHNHYDHRYYLLKGVELQDRRQLIRNPGFGLTPADLSKCDEYVASAYEASVEAGYRLGTGYNVRSTGYDVLAVLLFVTSRIGLRALRENQTAPQPRTALSRRAVVDRDCHSG